MKIYLSPWWWPRLLLVLKQRSVVFYSLSLAALAVCVVLSDVYMFCGVIILA